MTLMGSQTPTFHCAPDCVTNAAGEAVDLMAQLGRPLDPWQQFVLELWLGERGDGLWAAFECFEWVQRQNGKGEPLIARELAGLFLFGELLVLHTAHKAEAVRNAWLRTRELVEGSDDLTRRVKRFNQKDGEEGIELMSGAELQFRVRSGRGKGRGLSGDCVVADEALYLTQEDVDSFGPTLLARPHAQVILAGTPPADPDSPVVALRARAHAGAARVAGAEWTSPPKVDPDDPAAQARVNPTFGRRITAERMADMRRLLGEAGFLRECMGVWPDPATGRTIDPRRWATLSDSESRRGDGVTTIGVSVAPMRDVAAVVLYGTRADGLGHLQLVDHRAGTDWIPERLVELLDTVGSALVGMTRGTAASLDRLAEVGITAPERPEEPEHGDLVVLAGPDMAAACGQLVDAVRQATLRVIPSPDFDTAVAGASTRLVGDGITWVRRGLGTEAAPVEAASVARWVHATKAHLLVEDDYDVLESVY